MSAETNALMVFCQALIATGQFAKVHFDKLAEVANVKVSRLIDDSWLKKNSAGAFFKSPKSIFRISPESNSEIMKFELSVVENL